jgi:hypothetical protein
MRRIFKTFKTMVTIRSSAVSSEPTLIGSEVILTTPRGTYMISSNSSVADFSSLFGGGLFGAISWPRSQFRLAPGVVLDQQMLFPNIASSENLVAPGMSAEDRAAQNRSQLWPNLVIT